MHVKRFGPRSQLRALTSTCHRWSISSRYRRAVNGDVLIPTSELMAVTSTCQRRGITRGRRGAFICGAASRRGITRGRRGAFICGAASTLELVRGGNHE
jgi:hypothetical protein